MKRPFSLIRPIVRRLRPYVPGEQPRVSGLIKLNTNENPYPPSPRVLAAVRAAVDARLRLYPDPKAQPLRRRLARLHGCAPENIFVGNGADECLALAVRAFVEPRGAAGRSAAGRCLVQYFTPSYSLYPVLAQAHGASHHPVDLHEDFGLPRIAELTRQRQWRPDAALTFVTTPNAPSGRGYEIGHLDALCRVQRGVTVLDEAYVDFAREHAGALALAHRRVLVARTFSKAYSLCFQRVGYLIGHADLIAALDAIRDSYNVNGLGQIAALATLADLPYYRGNIGRIVRSRARLAQGLAEAGFTVLPSQANFILVKPPRHAARHWLGTLRDRKILVRWFDTPGLRQYLRISIGTDRDVQHVLRAVRRVLR